MDSLFNMLDTNCNKFYFDESNKKKIIIYQIYKKYQNTYTSHIKKEEYNIGEQLCDFLNTDFETPDSFKTLIKKYGINFFLNLTDIRYSDYPVSSDEYEKSQDTVINDNKYIFSLFRQDLILDIEYIFNMNNLEEIKDLTPLQRFQVMTNSDFRSKTLDKIDNNKVKINLSAFEILRDYSNYPMRQDETQRIVSKANINSSYFIECTDIIQTLLIELLEIAKLNIEIKKCRNCGKFFVPDNRSDEIYCSNIYENGKTCKEIGHFKVQQKLIQENDDLRIYRNVYQKLLLRTRRNPSNTKYAREFEIFKDDNNKWKENISKGVSTEKEYIEW
ncbi:MAG: hypothetical protein J6O41_06710, partial [Clostridia bacterium]|nr:hypothetical protein [Clostridia bacterium]